MTHATRLDLLDPAEVARLGGIEIVAAGVVEGFLAGLHRSPFRGFSLEFTEHRAYQPGDELRYLDWINNALVIEIVDPTPKHLVFGIYHPKVQTTVRVLSAADDAPKAAAGRTASA